MLSISKWSENRQIHKPLVLMSRLRARSFSPTPLRKIFFSWASCRTEPRARLASRMRFANSCSSSHFSWDACMSDCRWSARSFPSRYSLSRARTARLYVSCREAWVSLARWSCFAGGAGGLLAVRTGTVSATGFRWSWGRPLYLPAAPVGKRAAPLAPGRAAGASCCCCPSSPPHWGRRTSPTDSTRPREETFFGWRLSAARFDCDRVGRAEWLAATIKTGPGARPPAGGRPPDVPDPGPGGAGAPALADEAEGPWATARALATAQLPPGTGIPF